MFQLRKYIVKIHLADIDQFVEDPQLNLKNFRTEAWQLLHTYLDIMKFTCITHTQTRVFVCVIFWQCFFILHICSKIQYEQLKPCVQHVIYHYIHMPSCRSIVGCLIMLPFQLIAYIDTYPSHFILNSCGCKVPVKIQIVYILQQGIKDWTKSFW